MNSIETLKNILETKTGLTITIKLTNNKKQILKIKCSGKESKTLEVNPIFINAPNEVIEDIANFISGNNKKSSKSRIIKYVRTTLSEKNQDIKIKLNPFGNVYNLNDIFEKLNKQYFNGLISSRITFGRNRHNSRKRSIVFGNYDPQKNIIRINRALDNHNIPYFFVEYIVFHEMLHACMYFSGVSAMSMGHSKRFKSKEKIYPLLKKAKKWEKDNLKIFIGKNENI
ncbi:MAG TPA: hypothetical protein PLI50_00150 [bacterium]|nr:hypothetical protein [bacterium]